MSHEKHALADVNYDLHGTTIVRRKCATADCSSLVAEPHRHCCSLCQGRQPTALKEAQQAASTCARRIGGVPVPALQKARGGALTALLQYVQGDCRAAAYCSILPGQAGEFSFPESTAGEFLLE